MVDIYDWTDLDAVRNDLTASYTLQNDLDKDTAGYSGIGDDWTPFGFVSGDNNNSFTGTLDGAGHAIKDITGTVDAGVFDGNGFICIIDTGASITNLAVSGGLTFTNASGAGFGGLVGKKNDGSITNCVSNVNIDAGGGERVGGLVGEALGGTTEKCYALGDVTGGDVVAGLIGQNRDDVSQTYVAGSVTATGGSTVGGLVNDTFDQGFVSNSYWDTEATGQSTSGRSDGSEGGTGLTTSEMQGDEASTNMGGFDFSTVWGTVRAEDTDASADGYPILQALDRTNQLQAQGLFVVPKDGIYVGGTEYDCLVDGTQYDVVQN